jgi:hypothetical protein
MVSKGGRRRGFSVALSDMLRKTKTTFFFFFFFFFLSPSYQIGTVILDRLWSQAGLLLGRLDPRSGKSFPYFFLLIHFFFIYLFSV